MSAIYHTEPPTKGKVLIKTSYGDIDVELWSKEAPLACRNFVQLALEGYYDNSPIHRAIKGFMVQMGDPTGTGTGGKSIWGKPFKDEVHGRIKFNHRGQVAMANESKPNTNQSQFFITLDATPWLERKHTIFGKVTGNTLFNVMRMGDAEVGENDRPIDNIRILAIEVLWNPFDDIVPRDISKIPDSAGNLQATQNSAKETTNTKKPTKSVAKAVKDSKLLSFGDDGGDDDSNDEDADKDNNMIKKKIISVHDSKFKDKKMSSKVAAELKGVAVMGGGSTSTTALPSTAIDKNDRQNITTNEDTGEDFDQTMRKALLQKRAKYDQQGTGGAGDEGNNNVNLRQSRNKADEDSEDDVNQINSGSGSNNNGRELHSMIKQAELSNNKNKIESKTAEFTKLRDDLLRTRRAVNVMVGSDAEKLRTETAFKAMATPLEQMRMQYKKRKSDLGNRAEETLSKLQRFTQKLKEEKAAVSTDSTADNESSYSSAYYHGQVLEKGDYSSDEDNLGDKLNKNDDLKVWHQGKLKFKRHIDDAYRMGEGSSSSSSSGAIGGDGRRLDSYEVIDPRNQHQQQYSRA